MAIQFVAGDTASVLRVRCLNNDDNLPIGLGTTTPSLKWINQAGTTQTRTMTVTDADNGICQYQFQTAELEWPEMTVEVVLLDGTGSVLTNLDQITFPVKEKF